ncbi:BppU family phage baseplate upper protein [Enterococcus sp. C76]|uniref:BppU family phage baseplate upper protein n=1 Tax=Enterococcus sp. C76 TaxID=3231334 RepID=UPI0034A00B63
MVEENKTYKTAERTIHIEASMNGYANTGITFYSHDKGTAKLLIQLFKGNVPQVLSKGTVVPILLRFKNDEAESGEGRHYYNAVIEDPINGLVSIILNDETLLIQGNIYASVYIEFPNNQSIDTAGRFIFSVNRSEIDHTSEQTSIFFYSGFNEINQKYLEMFELINKDADTLQRQMDELGESFQELDIYNKPEIDEKLSEKASVNQFDDLDGMVQSLQKNKADQTFVDERIASIVSGSPKGTFNTLEELCQAYPYGASGVYVVLSTGHWYSWNKEWIDGGVYQSEKIGERKIVPANFKIDFENNLMELVDYSTEYFRGFYSTLDYGFYSNDLFWTLKQSVQEGDILYITTEIKESLYISKAMFFKDEDCTIYLSHIGEVPSTGGVYEDYQIYVPEGAKGVAVSSVSTRIPKIKKAMYVDARMTKAELDKRTVSYEDVQGELEEGFYSTINKQLNISDKYKSLKCPVNVGELLKFTAKCDTYTVATCVFWDKNGEKVKTIFGGIIDTYINYPIEVPENVTMVTISSSNDVAPKLLKQKIISTDNINNNLNQLNYTKSEKKMFIKRSENLIEIISKYDQENDLLFTFGIVSKNKTWQISNSYLLPNKEIYPSSDFSRSKTLLNKVFTDYVAPYHQLRAIQNIDGDKPNSADYTGGWHAYNNDSAGGDENTPTSNVESLKIFVDNVEVDISEQIIGGDEIKIVTTNLVQGTNTKKADGSGRAILREKVTYLVVGGKIHVEVELTALEPLTIKDYYFLQAANSDSYSKTLLPVDDNLYLKDITDFTEDIYGGIKGESYCSKMIIADDMNQLVIGIDRNFGLGRYQYNQGKSVWFYRNYGKVYFNLIASDSSTTIKLEEGEKLFAKGYYIFESKK